MREILFKAKRVDNGEWVEGWLFKTQEHSYIAYDRQFDDDLFLSPQNIFIEVDTNTICQYTGLTDKNGTKIFEGDVIRGLFLHSRPINSVVSFQDGAFGLLWNRAGVEIFWAFTSICNVEYEVIGNIHDNPELLKGGEEE